MSALALAWQFLTVVPWPAAGAPGARAFRWAPALFPVVGAAVGLAAAAVELAARRALPEPAGVVLAIATAVVLSGGLHLDGLADTCDGVFCLASPERRLEIMRDSRIGSFGAIAIALDLLVRYAVLIALPPPVRSAGLVLASAAGRWTMVVALWGFPYARPEGAGRRFKEHLRWPALALATIATLGMALAVAPGTAPIALLVALGVALGVALLMLSRLPGLTGDCYGAINEVAEVAFLIALAALWR
ncbi:MAG: adenosylcobinamide-GDP ribazoletransferase [Dehalococcoidia bacterium]|nr:adenosylcobinamide-GDP ribazoletransferase [Dehalococcoidia bacterium]